MTKINPTLELLRTSVLSLCYDDATLQGLCDRARAEGAVSVLMSLPRSDARKAIAGLLPRPQLVQWANASAQRAREYSADAADAARVAARAAYAAADAAAAAYAAAHDEILTLMADIILDALIKVKSPGCEFLDLAA